MVRRKTPGPAVLLAVSKSIPLVVLQFVDFSNHHNHNHNHTVTTTTRVGIRNQEMRACFTFLNSFYIVC